VTISPSLHKPIEARATSHICRAFQTGPSGLRGQGANYPLSQGALIIRANKIYQE